MSKKELDFTWVGPDKEKGESVGSVSISYWKDAMNRLFANKAAVVCITILTIIILFAIFAPMFSQYNTTDMNPVDNYLSFFSKDSAGGMHIFGTDKFGRDYWVRMWSGAQVSLIIAFAAVIVNFVIGVVYGGIAGYFGGSLDNFMMRFVEVIIGIPYLIIVILLMMVLPKGILTIIIAYAIVGWTSMARLVRGQIVQLKEQEFVMAAKVMGGSPFRIIAKHLIPNTLSVLFVNLTLAIPSAIFTESFLSYLGLGIPIPYASWGTLASEGAEVFMQYPHMLFIPAILISVTMLSFNLLGDGLRDAFDPKLRR